MPLLIVVDKEKPLLTIFPRIIVGVKYCFRYNRRNRQRAQNENGDVVDMAVMQRPHRRRREKKLMSMEDVNERFPLTKYKLWRSNRENEGLPTAGGIAQPGSRPASVKETSEAVDKPSQDADTSVTPVTASPTDKGTEPTSMQSTADAHTSNVTAVQGLRSESSAANPAASGEKVAEPYEKSEDKADDAAQSPRHSHDEGDDDEDDDDPTRTPAPPELLASPGDTCAICLDNLDDDDDVRGLTCGHAFHAGCLDPWLTGRRACCPLCKADYYVPKPNPELDPTNAANPEAILVGSNARIGVTSAPHGTMLGRVGGIPFMTFRQITNPDGRLVGGDVNQGRRQAGFLSTLSGRLRRNQPTSDASFSATTVATPTTTITNASGMTQSLISPSTPRPGTPRNTNLHAYDQTPDTLRNISSPISPSPNWRTRLLPISSASPSGTSTAATQSRLRPHMPTLNFYPFRRGQDAANHDSGSSGNYNNNNSNSNNANSYDRHAHDDDSDLQRNTSPATAARANAQAPTLPAPAFGAGITPGQLEAGVRA